MVGSSALHGQYGAKTSAAVTQRAAARRDGADRAMGGRGARGEGLDATTGGSEAVHGP